MIISITGPSGIGKGTLKEQLIKRFPWLRELFWFTTRPLRQSDTNRIHLTPAEFEEMDRQGELVLVQDLFGHRYGLKAAELLSASVNEVWMTEFHCQNVAMALALNPNIVTLALITHDQSILRHRLATTRKSESATEIELRLAAVVGEVATILAHRHLFTAVLEITAEDQDTIIDRAIELLSPQLVRER